MPRFDPGIHVFAAAGFRAPKSWTRTDLSAELKAALWVKANWKISGAVAAGLLTAVIGYWSYHRYWSRSNAVNAGLHAAVASATRGEGCSEPLATR